MTKTERRAYYSNLQAQGKLCGTVAAAMRLYDRRSANRPPQPKQPGTIAALADERRQRRSTPVVVPLGANQEALWIGIAKAQNPRLKEWSHGADAVLYGNGYSLYSTGSNSNMRKRSTFRRGVHVTSFATCANPGVAVLTLGTERHEIAAPRGYRWDIDANGLVLVGAAGDYHPTASHLIQGGKHCVEMLKQHAEVRKIQAAKAKQQTSVIRKAEKEGATVCLRDSLRAGNCEAGSRNWAARHGLDSRKHYRPSEVLVLANGDASRVALVIAVAMKRHRMEMHRGYAELADHR